MENFGSLASKYNSLAQSYKLQVTTKDIVNKASTNSLLNEDDFDKNIDCLMQSSAYHTLLNNVKVLASGWLHITHMGPLTYCPYSPIELETLQSVLLPSLDDNSVTEDENTSPSNSSGNGEVDQLEAILTKLKHEQELSNANIIQREKRIQEIKVESSTINIINTSSDNATNVSQIHQIDVLSRQIDAHKKNMTLLSVQNNELSELYEGIKSLNGIKLFEVSEARHDTSDAVAGIDIRMIIHDCEAIFSLDQSNTLCDIQIVSTKNSLSHVDINSILQESGTLTAPQDLRYAVFALKAAQTSTTILQTHISVLRKMCIVKLTGPLSLQITLNNGLTLLVTVHECYPEVPGAVHVDSMYGIGGWNADECVVMKAISNSKCFSNIVDLVEGIMCYVK